MSHTILLVEDNPDDAALALRALEQHHVANRVEIVHHGAEALDRLFADEQALPELVLLDLKLPKLNGVEVLRRIRREKRTALLPVVILTGSRLDSDLVAAYKNGANSYIRKPVNFDDFTDVVRELGAYWLSVNEAPPGGY